MPSKIKKRIDIIHDGMTVVVDKNCIYDNMFMGKKRKAYIMEEAKKVGGSTYYYVAFHAPVRSARAEGIMVPLQPYKGFRYVAVIEDSFIKRNFKEVI